MKFEESWVPDEAGAAPLDHEAMAASVSDGLAVNARMPAVPPEYFVACGPVL